MKTLLQLIAFLITASTIYIAFVNAQSELSINILFATKTINLSLYTFAIFLAGSITGSILIGQLYLALKNKFNAYKRELEKSSISNSTSESKINVLQAKIETLEKALNDALNNN